jgi:glutamine synthetase type III
MRYDPQSRLLDLGAAVLPRLEVPAEDRNRTSPFPYGGHRFEFRAVGSSQVIWRHLLLSAMVCVFKVFIRIYVWILFSLHAQNCIFTDNCQ